MRGLALVALVLGSCGDSLAWEYRFEPVELRDEAFVIEARVRLGGCEGTELSAFRFAPGERAAVAPAPLDDGTYGLEVEARDVACGWYARGCEVVEVPTSMDAVQVVLRRVESRVDCASCDAGRCPGELAD